MSNLKDEFKKAAETIKEAGSEALENIKELLEAAK